MLRKCRALSTTILHTFYKLLTKITAVLYQAEIGDLEELIFSSHCALNQLWARKGPSSPPSYLGHMSRSAGEQRQKPPLTWVGEHSAAGGVKRSCLLASAVSALGCFEAAPWEVPVLRPGEDTWGDVRKLMQASAGRCSCTSSNLSQLRHTHQRTAHTQPESFSDREAYN